MDPRQRHQQLHHHRRHEVLAEGEGEAEQHLGRQRSPQPPQRRQGFAQQQAAEHQGEQQRRQLRPYRQHGGRQQGLGQGTSRTQQQPKPTGQQRLRHTPLAAACDPAQGRTQSQHQRQGQGCQGPCHHLRGHHADGSRWPASCWGQGGIKGAARPGGFS